MTVSAFWVPCVQLLDGRTIRCNMAKYNPGTGAPGGPPGGGGGRGYGGAPGELAHQSLFSSGQSHHT